MPTGWRPEDVKEKYPIQIIQDVYNFKKYKPKASKELKAYSIFQLLVNTILMLFMFYNYSEIGFSGLLLFGAYIFIGIYGYSTLMDRETYAVWIEIFRSIAGLALIFITNDWFGLNSYLPIGSHLVGLYFVITIFGGAYFSYFEKKDTFSNLAS